MNCMAIDCFYVKANGEVPCWCSPGEHHPIAQLATDGSEPRDLVTDVLNGADFVQMRRDLHANKLPFDYCRGCSFLRNDGDAAWTRVDTDSFRTRSINTLQVESSFLCNVDCPLCVRLPVRRKVKDPPFQLDLGLYRKLVDDLVRNAIEVREIWFSGRGEPLMNPDFPAMVAYGREQLGSRVTCHTNGNFTFREELLTCGLASIEIAFDGVDQESYERYRRGGKLERVARFAADFADAKRNAGGQGPELVWKMVLFEWNSSDADLERAAAWAEELGLDRIEFMNTDTPGGMSHRDGGKRLAEVAPLIEELGARHPRLVVELQGYHSHYSTLPDVETALRTDEVGSDRTVIMGRLFNHLLESKHVRVELRLQDDVGGPEHQLVDVPLELPERSELVESFAIPHDALKPGEYRVRVMVIDAASGELLSEAATDFQLG